MTQIGEFILSIHTSFDSTDYFFLGNRAQVPSPHNHRQTYRPTTSLLRLLRKLARADGVPFHNEDSGACVKSLRVGRRDL